jgi:hypothetical protein
MRWHLVLIAITSFCVSAPMSAEASRRDPKAPPSGGVRVTTSGNQVKYTVKRGGRPGGPARVRVNPGAVTCRYRSVSETVTAGAAKTVVEHRWRQCFSTATGRPTGPEREVIPGPGGSAPSEEVWTAVVPDPVLQRQNDVRFVTQRTAWVWLPPQYFRGIRVDLRSSTGQLRPGAATARAIQVVVNPGYGGPAAGVDCTAEAQFPYDGARDFWDQSSCGLWFMKSSIDEPGGAYTATVTVAWEVNAVVDGEVAETATVVTDSQAAIRVEELQALVTCVGGSAGSCPTGNTTRK